MIDTGEKSGALDDMLNSIAEQYDVSVKSKIEGLVRYRRCPLPILSRTSTLIRVPLPKTWWSEFAGASETVRSPPLQDDLEIFPLGKESDSKDCHGNRSLASVASGLNLASNNPENAPRIHLLLLQVSRRTGPASVTSRI